MKKWYLPLMVVLLLITFRLSGQEVPQAKPDAIEKMFSNVPKKTNMIVLMVADTNALAILKQVKLLLADWNIFPAVVDNDLGLINTQDVPRKVGTSKYSIRVVRVDDSCQIRINGQFKTGMELNLGGVTGVDSWSMITKKGMNGSIYMDNYYFMEDIARGLAANLSVNGVEFIDNTKSAQSTQNRNSDKFEDPVYN